MASRASRIGLIVVVVVSGVLIAHAASFLPFFADDALISLRYSERLLDGKGLTWNDGERVEGYSNLLWILLCSLLGLFTIDLITAARILGLTASVTALLALFYAHPPRDAATALPALGSGLALALSGPLAAWSVGGLEQPLVAGLLAWALVLSYPLLRADDPSPSRRAAWLAPAVPLALLCWTRPDGALFTATVCVGVVAAHGLRRRSLSLCLALSSLPALAYLGQLAFRLSYYREWFPNSAAAKLALSGHRLAEGSSYLGLGLLWLGAFALPTLALALGSVRQQAGRRVRFLLCPLLAWSAYVVVIGGDIFPARRHLVPLLVIFALLAALALERLVRTRSRRRRVAWIVAPLLLFTLGVMQSFDPANRSARDELWEWDGEVVGKLLRRAFADEQPLLAVDPAGTLPYFSKLPAIDMLGINDHFLAHNRPPEFGTGYLGHELGNGDYVLGREPDLVLFCKPSGGSLPCFPSGMEMYQDPRFEAQYRLVQIEGDDPYRFRSGIWFRLEGGKLGIRRRAQRVEVPGYLLSGNPDSIARLHGDVLATRVTPQTPAGIANLALEPGAWQAAARHSKGRIGIEVFRSADQGELGRAADRLRFRLEERTKVDVILAVREPLFVLELIFERQE